MSNYTLSIAAFRTADNAACLAEILAASEYIGKCFVIRDNAIVFEPEDSSDRWLNKEEEIIPVIMRHIAPGTTCLMTWEDVEGGDSVGVLIGRGRYLDIIYKMMAATNNGPVDMVHAETMLAGCPDCEMSDTTRQACADGKGTCVPPAFYSSWDYHVDGEHAFPSFTKKEWCQAVTGDQTILGYQDWVEHRLEEMINDIDLDGVDAVEVAGCTDTNGAVEVTEESEAQFFSVYTQKQGEFTCICDFNNKTQAIEFGQHLALLASARIYGNKCDISMPCPNLEYSDCSRTIGCPGCFNNPKETVSTTRGQ